MFRPQYNPDEYRPSRRALDCPRWEEAPRLARPSPTFTPKQLPSGLPCVLTNIPLEILLKIICHLPTPWVITLALTCKDLLAVVQLLYRKKLHIKDHDIAAVVATLQRDIPRVYCCIGCYMLRPLNLGGTWKDHDHQHCMERTWWKEWISAPRDCLEDDIAAFWHPSTRESTVHFMEAHLVMNRHIFGELHGLPLQTLARQATFEKFIVFNHTNLFQQFHWHSDVKTSQRLELQKYIFDQRPEGAAVEVCPETPWRFSFNYQPRIINDTLYIARFHTVDGPKVRWVDFAGLLNSMNLPICCHLQLVAEVLALGNVFVRHCDRDNNEPSVIDKVRFSGLYQDSGTCTDCNTDYDFQFSLKTNGANDEWSLLFCTYHHLGACRSQYDDAWLNLASRQFIYWGPLTEFSFECPNGGKARQMWHKSSVKRIR